MKGVWLVLGEPPIKVSWARCLSFTGISEGAGMMHVETEGKHLVVITSELVGVGEISSPI